MPGKILCCPYFWLVCPRRGKTQYSDIDVCIVRKEYRDSGTLLYDEIYPHVRMDEYDVVIFEGCSMDIRSDIARSHIVVECRDNAELSEYLKPYREYRPAPRSPKEILNELRSVVDAI